MNNRDQKQNATKKDMLLPQNLNQNHMRVLLLEQMLEGYEIQSAGEYMKLFPH